MDKLEETLRALVRDEVQKALAEHRTVVADQYLSTTAAARIADVAAITIRRWIKSGKLTRHEAGREIRVSRLELEALLRRGVANDELTPEELADRAFG